MKNEPSVELFMPVIGTMQNPHALPLAAFERGRLVEHPDTPLRPTEIARVLSAGFEKRLNLNFLIHSSGGRVVVLESYREVVAAIKSLGGTVRAYVPSSAGSAAAFLLTLADKRYVTPGTRVLFHIQAVRKTVPISRAVLLTEDGEILPVDLCVQRHEPLEETREADRSVVRSFLLDGVREDFRGHVQSALQDVFEDPTNPRDEIVLHGNELGLLGKATVLPRQRDLRIQFMNDTGIHLPGQPGLREIWRDCENSQVI